MMTDVATTSAIYRYERKFYITDSSRPQIESIVRLNSGMFSEIYYRRWVNNIYLDTWSMASYHENLIGCSHDRVKYRIRWYGDLTGRIERPVLELKVKHGEVNRKQSYQLGCLAIPDDLRAKNIRDLLSAADLPVSIRGDLQKLRPMVVNRYNRNYFLSADRRLRLTIDSDIEFYDGSRDCGTLRFGRRAHGAVVLELKYPIEAAAYAERISQQFPFRMTRSSKYVLGVEHTLPA